MRGRWAANVGLVGLSLGISLALFEAVLWSGVLNDVSIHWIAPEYEAINKRVMAPSDRRTARNPMSFNGPIPGPRASAAYPARLMVLGDSFVWGFGLPYGQGLTQKIRRRVQELAPGIDVLGFGRPGWSTVGELRFVENEGRAYGLFDADFILIAFVVNDPDLLDQAGHEYRKKIDWDKWGRRSLLKALPNTINFLTGHLDWLMEMVTDDHGETNWINYLWSDRNLAGFRPVVERLKAQLAGTGTPFAFALLPATPDAGYHGPKFERMASMLDALHIPYVNLLPRVVRSFEDGDYGTGYRRLWANPADGHPGDEMTSVLADGIVDYLQGRGVIARLASKPKHSVAERFASLPLCENDRHIRLTVTRFDRYRLAEGEVYLRVEGTGFEVDPPSSFTPLQEVYVLIGNEYFQALPRIPLQAKLANGEMVPFNGFFAIDVPVLDGPEQRLQEAVAVTGRGCTVFRPFIPSPGPRDNVPPPLDNLPVLRFDQVFQ